MAEIRCSNCGGTHARAVEVRRCFIDRPNNAAAAWPAVSVEVDADRPADLERDAELDRYAELEGGDLAEDTAGEAVFDRVPARPGPVRRPPARRAPPRARGPAPRAWYRPAIDWAGPDPLGRGLIIAPGGEVPSPWADQPRFGFGPGLAGSGTAMDAAAMDAAALDELIICWTQRRRFVVEWHAPAGEVDGPEAGPPSFGADAVVEATPWAVGVAFAFTAEGLEALLRDHAVDARHPEGARFRPAEAARALGASGAEVPGADVVSPEGEPLLIDGGPLAPGGRGTTAVVPVALVASGRLTPLVGADPQAELAPDQLAAVGHRGGGARIIAPAGSGKTRVLTERARLLLGGWQLPADLVTLVAFNVRAAEEIRERTADLPGLHVRTLNSLGLAIINGTAPFLTRPDARRLATIDETEVRRILEGLVRFPRRAGTDPAAPWLEALSAVRLGLRHPAEVEQSFGGDVDGFAEVLPRYRAELARRGALDYDEQIAGAIERLLVDPLARRTAQAACRVLLVDEFQDLAPAHLLLVRLLSAPTYDCFGVGDDDQTIYGYVGASPDWLVRFDRWFPGAGDHPLTINYRCAPGVVTAASNLLTRNRLRVAKAIVAAPGRLAGDDDLVVRRVPDVAGTTCETVAELVGAGAAPAEIAVLTRVNVTLLAVQLRLAAAGIPTTAPVDSQLLSRSGVRAALAWVALAAAGRDGSTALPAGLVADAARRPPRALSPKLLEWMDEQRSVEGLRRLASRLSAARDQDKVEAFAADVELLVSLVRQGADTAAVLRAVADRIGLGAAMETLDRSRGTVDRSAHGDDLAALEAVAHLHPDPAGFGPWLRRQLTDSGRSARPDGVQLATVHRVKGREWPYVIVHDASAGLLPHRLAVDLEEERRIFHVALTRSSRRTVVVADLAAPSPFLAELDAPGAPLPEPAGAGSGSGDQVGSGQGASRRSTRPTPASASVGAGAAGPGAAGLDAHQPSVEGLKVWRRERAQQDAIPAYVVLPDKAIEDIARRRPSTLVELARCHGIGPAKLERYGDEVLAILDNHR